MTIEIIGSGALGMVFGARLAHSGSKVRMRAKTPEQADLLNREGIQYTDLLRDTTHIPITSISSSSLSSRNDTEWILLGVKQTAIDESIFSLLNEIATPYTPVICVQNGIGHMEKLRSELPGIPFLAAVSTEGALRTGQNSVVYTGKGSLWIEKGSLESERDSLLLDARNAMLSSLQNAGIDAQFSGDVDAMVLKKLLANAVINPLTALYGVKNGQLSEVPLRLKLMRALFEETRGILERSYGKRLGEDLWDYVLKLCENTANNESSMLSDVRAQRQTEVRWINGGVLELAKQMNAQAPLNVAMVELLESLTSA